MSDNSIVLKDGERSIVINHRGREFKFYFPDDVTHITPIYEGDEVVCACMYGIIYPAGLLTKRAVDKSGLWRTLKVYPSPPAFATNANR